MEESSLGLDQWLAAMWLISNCKNRVSSYEIHCELGIAQKTAWFVLDRVWLTIKPVLDWMEVGSGLNVEGGLRRV